MTLRVTAVIIIIIAGIAWEGIFFSTFYLGLLGAVIVIPVLIKSHRQKWFGLIWAITSGVATTVLLYAFQWTAVTTTDSHLWSDRLGNLRNLPVVPLGLFVFVACLIAWSIENRKALRSK